MKAYQILISRIPLLCHLTAIGLSGGSDSMALLWLAKQLFSNVVGLTVDHRCVCVCVCVVRCGMRYVL